MGTVRPESTDDMSMLDVGPLTIGDVLTIFADFFLVQLRNTGATIIKLDYKDEGSIIEAVKEFGIGRPLNLLVNCGGI